MEKSLVLSNVFKNYTQGDALVHVLKGVSATFEQGKSYAVTGVSGSGKSTLIHLLAGLEVPNQGIVTYDSQDINLLSEAKKSIFLNKTIGLVFQYPYLIKELTVLENVMIKGLIAHGHTKEVEQQALSLLQNVGLAQKTYSYPGQLSGGQQQRVALARALMNNPKFLLADEPTGNLDPQTAQTILDLIMQAQKEWGMGLIISSHDEYVTKKMEKIYTLKDEKLELCGSQ